MNHRVNKILSPLLAAMLVAGSGTMTFAKNYDDVDSDHKAKTEISILSDIGVIKGTADGEFSPNDLVTREQMATFLFRLMLGRDDAGRVNTTGFTDLYEPYYNGAISWANAAGYLLGTSKTTFNPKGGITKQDAMTMLVRALGQDNDKMNAGYPWSYINAAIKLGLDRGLENVKYDETLTRADTAVILYNALTAEYRIDRVTPNGNISYEITSIIEDVFDYSMTEAVLVSTNDYAIHGGTTVKNGYVTLRGTDADKDSFSMTVPFEQLDLDGSQNDHLGHAYRVIYNTVNGKHSVLSAVPMTKAESYITAELDTKRDTVEIGGTKYTLVDKYSDELSTNNNELLLYAFDNDGELELIEDIDELSDFLGFYRITLLSDNGNETAKRGILREFKMNTLEIDSDGGINLADGEKEEDLNFINEADAEEDDYVLYYYNEETDELHIAEVLDYVEGKVKRITSSTVRIGDESYDLGNPNAGITADSIHKKLELGSDVTAVIWNGAVVAIADSVTLSESSNYLIALSDTQRIYEDGSFRYVMTAFIDGEEKNIFVKKGDIEEGKVYRYTKSGDEYKLIAPETEDGKILAGKNEFVQNQNGLDEIAYLINSAKNTTIELGGKNYYTISRGDADSISSADGLSNIRFISDKNTVIIVNDNGTLMQRTGEYSSTIQVKDGAYVAAIFNNEVGSVETLRYLYISDGELGNYDLDAEFVRILAANGLVYEDGKAYVEYIVYNFADNTIETRLSKSDDLVIGEDYRCGSDDTITSVTSDHVQSGFISGYTSGTVSIDGSTYTHAAGMKVLRITKNNKGNYVTEDVKLADLYMTNVEFITDKGAVTFILEIADGGAKFTAEASGNTITVRPNFDLSSFSDSRLSLNSIADAEGNKLDLTGTTIAFGADNTITVTLPETIAAENGDYTLTFRLGSREFAAEFTYEKPAAPEQPEQPEEPEQPEQPETPETPEQPEQPEQPEEPETPETPEQPETPETPETPDQP
ncbi:MAG: S-layer homology domain-containing protein [Ruminococcaceae bacterium]|nr:S-layer homology domain-containing protein [Oscillospiraceae bacterium]